MAAAAAVLSDAAVARVRPVATIESAFLARVRDVEGHDVPAPLQALCSPGSWSDAALLANAAVAGSAASTDHQGFVVHADGMVTVFEPRGASVLVSSSAFRDLLGRLLDVVMAAATETHDPITSDPVWPELVAARARLAGTP